MGNGQRITNIADPDPTYVTLGMLRRQQMLADYRFFYLLKVLVLLTDNKKFTHPYLQDIDL